MHSGVAQAQAPSGYKAHQTRRRRRAEGAVVAGRDAAEPALRHRHQGPGRLAHLLRAAGQRGTRTASWCRCSQPRFPRAANGGVVEGRQDRDLEAEARRHLARRQTVHCRRLRLQLGIRQRSRYRSCHREHLQRRGGQEDRLAHYRGHVPKPTPFWADPFCRHPRHADSETPVCRLHRRQVARRARQPEARGHRAVQIRRLQAGRHGARRDQHQLPRARTARSSTRSK